MQDYGTAANPLRPSQLAWLMRIEVVTPVDPNLSCAIASFRINNKMSAAVADHLFKAHHIFTVGRTLGKQGCVRVTPSVYNSFDDVNRLAEAIRLYADG
jgi:selenocysteine lyase/cysteine desulfurase